MGSDEMAAARRHTRLTARRRNARLFRGALRSPNPAGIVEVIDLVDSDGEGNAEEGGGEQEDVEPAEEETVVNEEEVVEELSDEQFEGKWQARFDFEGESSIPNLTVRSFLKDCYNQPKILCHKRFAQLRNFMEEACGFKFQLPEGCPFSLDHEDDTFCVDRGDKWLVALKERFLLQQQKEGIGSNGGAVGRRKLEEKEEDDSDSDEEGEEDQYHWATITPVQKRSDLGLIVFRWKAEPMSEIMLDLYVTWCRENYVPPPPKIEVPPIPEPKKVKRRRKVKGRRGRRRSLKKKETGKVEVEKMEVDEDKEKGQEKEEEEVDNGVDDYIKSFLEVFKLDRNIDAEERLKGDLEARAQRARENKEEPKYSRELSNLIRLNRLIHSKPKVQQLSPRRPPRPYGGASSSSDSESSMVSSSSSSVSSKHSEDSEYRACHKSVKGLGAREPHKKRSCTNTTTSSTPKKVPPVPVAHPKMLEQLISPPAVVLNALGLMLNGTVNGNRPVSRTSSVISNTSSSHAASPSTTSGSSASSTSTPKKRPVKFSCDVCRPPKIFTSRKGLYKHLTRKHCSSSREMTKCDCGISVRRERLEFHKRYCKKTILLQAKNGIRKLDSGSMSS